jgi:hypothetical protein
LSIKNIEIDQLHQKIKEMFEKDSGVDISKIKE